MRRFELVEGQSSKFWEIEVDGQTLTTRWGRIGTNGQTKTKTLPDAEAADRDAQKLISAKTTKGYAEVAASLSAGSARENAVPPEGKGSPGPLVGEADASDESVPAASDSSGSPKPKARSADHHAAAFSTDPRRAQPGGEPLGTGLPDEDAFVVPSSWRSRLHVRRGWTVGPSLDFDVGEQLKRMMKAAPPDTELPTPETLSSWNLRKRLNLAESLAPMQSWQPESGNEAFVRLLYAEEGLFSALKFATHLPQFTDNQRMPESPGLRILRAAIAWASDEERAAVREQLQGVARSQDAKARRAYLFPEDATWWDEVVNMGAGSAAELIQVSVPSVDLVQLGHRHEPGLLESLVVAFRGDVVPVLSARLKASAYAEDARAVAAALVPIPDDRAVEAVFDAVRYKGVMEQIPALFERFPRRCMRVGARHSSMQVHLRGWVASRPDVVQALAAEDPELGAKLRSVADSFGAVLPDAELSELPAFLSEPPWRKKSKPKVSLKIEPNLPAPAAVLTSSEEAEVAARQKALEAVSEDHRSYRQTERALRVLLFDENPIRRTAAGKVFAAQYMWGAPARINALTLVALRPDEAGPILLAARVSSSDVLAGLLPLKHPDVARFFLEALGKKRDRALARTWMERHPEYAIRAWVPLAVGPAAKLRAVAEGGLRLLAQRHRKKIGEITKSTYPEAAPLIDELLDVDLAEGWPHKPAGTKFLNLGALPRPKLQDAERVLPAEAVEVLVEALAASKPDAVFPGIEEVKACLESRSLAALAWAIFEQWLSAGAPSKEGWPLPALGMVGDDEVAHRLTPLVRAWPGESQHARAVAGLDALLGIGTDVALMHLNGVAQKVKFRGIKEQAQERMQILADELGLTREQLADRLVPSLDLDARGTMVLDYGPRKFVVGFDEALKPFVKDASGKRLKSLPKPGAKDDAALAEPAEARFKALKKSVRAMASLQVTRLENAMVIARRWTQEDFEQYLVRHPLLIHLVRRLVWGVFDGEEGAPHSFRVTEDSSYADENDDELELPVGPIGLVHPVDLGDGATRSWSEVLSDYELLQPFLQLGRPVHHLTEAEKKGWALRRHANTRVEVGRVLGLLNKGWERGPAFDGGVVAWLVRPLDDDRHELQLRLGEAGLWTGMGAEQTEKPSIDCIKVTRLGAYAWDDDPKESGAVPRLGELPASLSSELIETLERLVAAS